MRSLSCALALATVLLACSGSPPLRHDDEGRLIITTNNGPLKGQEERLEEERQMLALFEEMYPGYTYEASTWQYSAQTFLARVAGNTCTDVVGISAAYLGKSLAEAALAMDITSLLESWEHGDDINPVVLRAFQSEGRTFGLPAGPGYTMCLAFNRRMFIEAGIVDENGEPDPPNTWEELVECAVALTDRESGVYGFAVLDKDSAASWHFLNWVYQAGGDFERQDEEGHWSAVFNEPEAVRALQFLHDLRYVHNVIPRDTFMANDDQLELFAADQLAMMIFVPEYLDIMDRLHSYPIENIGITMLPAGPGGYACVMGGGFGIINPRLTDPEQIQGAFNIITFSISSEKLEALYRIRSEQGRPVGWPSVSIWQGETGRRWREIEDRYRNVPEFPEYTEMASRYARYEPPIRCAQLYADLVPVIQQALRDEDADCQQLLSDAAERFERRQLY
jgi:multiple sugar transport system substrate-binding protein